MSKIEINEKPINIDSLFVVNGRLLMELLLEYYQGDPEDVLRDVTALIRSTCMSDATCTHQSTWTDDFKKGFRSGIAVCRKKD